MLAGEGINLHVSLSRSTWQIHQSTNIVARPHGVERRAFCGLRWLASELHEADWFKVEVFQKL